MSGFPEYSGDDALSLTTSRPVTPQVVDDHGRQTVYGTTDNLDPSGNFPLDSRVVEFIEYGVLNGSFARSPADPNHDITDINYLPDWTGPVSVSGGAITAQWVADASSPSGYNLRFTVNAGASSDEAYFEQIVPIGGTRGRQLDHLLRVLFYRVVGSSSNFVGTMALQYLNASGAAVGSELTTTITLTADATEYWSAIDASQSLGAAPGATARSARIRVGVRRTSTAAATLTVDVCDVRLDRGNPYTLFPDITDPTKTSGFASQAGGLLTVYANLSTSLALDGVNNIVQVNKPIWVPESTGGTPSSGFHAIYAKTADSKLYSKDDSGTEYKLSLTAGTDYQAADAELAALAGLTSAADSFPYFTGSGTAALQTIVSAIRTILGSANASTFRSNAGLAIGTNVQAWDADLDTLAAATVGTGGTFTPALAYATVGSSSWATTTAVGFYTRLLDRVIFNFTYQGVPTNGTGAGNLQLSGLPVTSQNTASSGARFSVEFQGYTKANFTQITGFVNVNTAIATFRASGSAQTTAALTVTDIPTGGTVIVSGGGHYLI